MRDGAIKKTPGLASVIPMLFEQLVQGQSVLDRLVIVDIHEPLEVFFVESGILLFDLHAGIDELREMIDGGVQRRENLPGREDVRMIQRFQL